MLIWSVVTTKYIKLLRLKEKSSCVVPANSIFRHTHDQKEIDLVEVAENFGTSIL